MGQVMEIRPHFGEKQRKFVLDKDGNDAVADYVRERWPSGTAKATAKEFDLSVDEARAAVGFKASYRIFIRIIKRGGWKVAIPILTAIIGESLDQHLARERAHHAEQAARLDALAHDLWPSRSVHSHRPDRVGSEGDRGLEPEHRRVGQGSNQKAAR